MLSSTKLPPMRLLLFVIVFRSKLIFGVAFVAPSARPAWSWSVRQRLTPTLTSRDDAIVRTRPACRKSGTNISRQLVRPTNDATATRLSMASASAASTSAATAAATANKSDGKTRLATGMAFLTGWADVFLFFKFRTFATMMTGNTMWMASALVEGRYRDVAYYATVIASYLAGLAAFRRTDLRLRGSTMKACAAAVTTLFVVSDVIHSATGGAAVWIPVMMLAAAYGIANSVGAEVAGTLTFVITGHMTKLTNQVVDRVSRRAGRRKLTAADRWAAVQNASVVGGFFCGAMWACFLKSRQWLHRAGVFSTLGILYGLLFLWQDDMESLGGAWWLRKGGEMCDLDDDGDPCDLEEKAKEQQNTSSLGDE